MQRDKLKGVILAGGTGTRLGPLTEITNKHLLPVGKEPMIWHCVRQLVSAGVVDIMVITSTNHMGSIVNSLGSGVRFGCEFTYRVQERPGGIADALALCREFTGDHKLVVLLGDNVFEYSIRPYIEEFLAQPSGGRVLLKRVDDPARFGIASLDETFIVEIEEKPHAPKSDFAVIGCYMYDARVYEFIDGIEPSARGELEITSVNNLYVSRKELYYSFVRGRWTDAGTFESLSEANALLLSTQNRILE